MWEILFRGKRKDNGEWFYGYYRISVLYKESIIDSAHSSMSEKVIPETVGQYTGLEANGVKIFEGDIVRWISSDMDTMIDKVQWLGSGLCLRNSKNTVAEYLGYDEKLEIIGNIHDNPELLET